MGKGGKGKGLNSVGNEEESQWEAAEEYESEDLSWSGHSPEVMSLSINRQVKAASAPSLNQLKRVWRKGNNKKAGGTPAISTKNSLLSNNVSRTKVLRTYLAVLTMRSSVRPKCFMAF